MSLSLFARLTKVDEEKRLVYGRATEEVVDRSGEIMDYATSKPYFEKWSGDVAKATDGRSVGNLRAMHSNIAAGKLTAIDFLDEEKAIDICAKVVDDAEWEKVLEGVYTGFSIGGDYVKRWADAELNARRFTADPCEISLVDLPCVPTASFFSIEKADGSVMQKAFKAPEPVTADAFSDEVAALAKAGDLSLDEMLDAIRKAKDDKKKPYGDVKYADEKNSKYPIDTEEHIRAAWSYINKEKNAAEYSADELKTVKDRIIAAWKDKIDKDGPPSAADKWAEPVLTKGGKPVIVSPDNLTLAARLALHKGMYSVSSLANLLASISYLQQSSAREEAAEGDKTSTLPDDLMDWLKQGGELLTAMVAEEVAELTEDDGMVDSPCVYYFECATAVENLHKAVSALGGDHLHESFEKVLAKAGARNSGADMARIQKAHDLMGELGAKCAKDADEDMDAEKAAHAETLSKLTAAGESVTKLTADLATATEQVAKAAIERDELTKAVATLAGERDTLQKQFDEQAALVKKLSETPVDPKGALNSVAVAIGKSHDFVAGEQQEEVEPVRKADGSIDEAATAIKKARRNGGVIVFRG